MLVGFFMLNGCCVRDMSGKLLTIRDLTDTRTCNVSPTLICGASFWGTP